MQVHGPTYFERPLPIALVFGAFGVLVVPLALLQLVPNFIGVVPHLMLLCAIGLGTSHFFLTLAIYASRTHLAYFASSKQRTLLYFGLPLAIFAFLAWVASSGIREIYPHEIAFLFAFIRLLDFFHVGRQGFGMLQLWKRPLRDLPAWTRTAENTFFVGAAAMQWQTFWVGGVFPADRIEATLPAAALAVLFVSIASAYLRQLSPRGDRASRLAFAYFVVQAICSAASIYRTWLYLTALAVHYLEYHVIMYPRCFTPEAGDKRSRVIDWLRRPLLFYALMLPVLIAFELRNTVQPDSRPLTFLVHVFDGIFVVHYVLDAFLWRFSNPFYRQTLGPLYLGATRSAPSVAIGDSSLEVARARPRRSQTWALAIAMLAVLTLGAAHVMSARVRSLEASVLDPIHAQNHLRWGIELARSGAYTDAKAHLNAALERSPSSAEARDALSWVHSREAPAAIDRP